MTTFEKFRVTLQIVQNLEGLRDNMRDNALAYKAAVLSEKSVGSITQVIRADASEYLRRLGWVNDIPGATKAELLNFFALVGLAKAEVASVLTELTGAANIQAAVLDTVNSVNTVADAVLATVSAHLKLW